MPGIIGFTRRQSTAPILLDGLKNHKYQGYSSTGIAVMHHVQIANDILFRLPATVEWE